MLDRLQRPSVGPAVLFALLLAAVASLGQQLWRCKKLVASLTREALHDPLTGLPNRLLLLDRSEQALARRERSGGAVALVYLDLDDFKVINDVFGHAVGDEVLTAVGQRVAGVLRPADTLARLGGDEFVAVCERLGGHAEAQAIVDRIRREVERPFQIDGRTVAVSASVGIALATDDSQSVRSLLAEADAAMYRGKHDRRERVQSEAR